MSQENVEAGPVSSSRHANRTGELAALTSIPSFHPEIEFEDDDRSPLPWTRRVYRGRDEFRERVRRNAEIWQAFHLEDRGDHVTWVTSIHGSVVPAIWTGVLAKRGPDQRSSRFAWVIDGLPTIVRVRWRIYADHGAMPWKPPGCRSSCFGREAARLHGKQRCRRR